MRFSSRTYSSLLKFYGMCFALATALTSPGLAVDVGPGNLVAWDVLACDSQTGATWPLSKELSGSPASGKSVAKSISRDGKLAVFYFDASGIESIDKNGASDIYMAEAVGLPVGLTMYVSLIGSDDNPGTADSPFRTIQHAATVAQPGTTVYVRGGVYNEIVNIQVSGNATQGPIVFGSYPNEQAIVDGSDLSSSAGDLGLFSIFSQSYIVIRGFEIRNYQTSTAGITPAGILVSGSGHNLQILNNVIHDIKTTASEDANAHGIAIYGTDKTASYQNIKIDGNELYDLTLGTSEALVLNGNVEGFSVTRNYVHDVDNIAMDFIGFEGTAGDPAVDQARNGIVSENIIENVDSQNNPAYFDERSAGGIYVDGGTKIVIERNRIAFANIGIEIASEHHGRATSLIIVRNNVIHDSHVAGLALGGYEADLGSTFACCVVNNTFFHNDTDNMGYGELWIQYNVHANLIKNNIFSALSGRYFISSAFPTVMTNQIDHNLYFAPEGEVESSWLWRGIAHTSFSAYQTGSSNDSHGRFGDPLFVDAAKLDFHLDETSPAVDAGENTGLSGALDIDAEARVQNLIIDIGADETPKSEVEFK